jgi:wyosine [tRNA(Phe)-imidazoG37] synthetase (radical SAM superfamily)
MITFGPVPSRRLGSSLGINHIPPKYCPYSCVYCQVGRTTHMEVKRREFYPLEQILGEVDHKISQCSQAGTGIDYLTLVPDGEPALDVHLGELIQALKRFGIPVAVISNASLIDRQDVQDELSYADWVSLKVDTLDERLWRNINRPHRRLSFLRILDGMLAFRKQYQGELVTESMLLGDLNDGKNAIRQLCDFLLELQPFKSYLSIPTRPPAERSVSSPSPQALQEVLQVCADRISFIDVLFDTEIGQFVSTGNLVDDILSITAVHPLREEALRQMVTQAGKDWQVVEDLLTEERIAGISYRNERFYLRTFKHAHPCDRGHVSPR